jgi:hypothetical protein
MFYVDVLTHFSRSAIPILVGGTFALARYTGIERSTKDLDLFAKPEDIARALASVEQQGYHVEVPFPHWLAKIRSDGHVIDLIFSSGNGLARVDDCWFEHAVKQEILDCRWSLPAEEMIWSKAFVQERERFDGVDILHLIHQRGSTGLAALAGAVRRPGGCR